MTEKTRIYIVKGCHSCPHAKDDNHWGSTTTVRCTAVTDSDGKHPAVCHWEYNSEKRKNGDFPSFCPLKVNGKRTKASKTKRPREKKIETLTPGDASKLALLALQVARKKKPSKLKLETEVGREISDALIGGLGPVTARGAESAQSLMAWARRQG